MPKISDAYREERRQALISAAHACFARKGFAETSMQDIFQEAGVSAGGFYRYFTSKADLVAAIAENTAEALEEIITEAASGAESVGDFAARLIDGVAEFDRESGRAAVAVQVWAEAARNPEIRELVLRVVGRAFGRVASVTSSPEEARVLLALTQGFLLQRTWDRKPSPRAFSQAVRDLLP